MQRKLGDEIIVAMASDQVNTVYTEKLRREYYGGREGHFPPRVTDIVAVS